MPEIVKGDVHLYVPEGFTELPTTPLDALKQARALLVEEGRWIKDELYYNPDPHVDPDTPFCNSWGVCALGAIWTCTLGFVQRDPDDDEGEGGALILWKETPYYSPDGDTANARCVYDDASNALVREMHRGVAEFNDDPDTTRQDVIDKFDLAIAELETASV